MLRVLLGTLLLSCDFTSSLNKDVLEAQELLKKNDFQNSAHKYEEILRHNPPPTLANKINYQIAEIYSLYLNESEKALFYYEQVLNASNDQTMTIKVLEKKAEILFTMKKDFKKSSEVYEKLINLNEKDKNYFYIFRKAVSLRKASQFEESEKIFFELVQNIENPYYIDSLNELAFLFFYKKSWKKAIEQWSEYLKYEKNEDKIVQTKFLIANAYETNGDLKEAYDIYYSILPTYPNSEVLKTRLKSLFSRRAAVKR
jgi:tetratricopeptide (TPR) repeat protein